MEKSVRGIGMPEVVECQFDILIFVGTVNH